MAGICLVCQDNFVAHKRGYLRKSTCVNLRGQEVSVKEGLHNLYPVANFVVPEDSFVCTECYSCVGQVLKKKTELEHVQAKL